MITILSLHGLSFSKAAIHLKCQAQTKSDCFLVIITYRIHSNKRPCLTEPSCVRNAKRVIHGMESYTCYISHKRWQFGPSWVTLFELHASLHVRTVNSNQFTWYRPTA